MFRFDGIIDHIARYWAFVPYSISAFLVILGLHVLLYNDWATHLVITEYFSRGELVWGDVIACEDTGIRQYETTIVYQTVVGTPRYHSGRHFFRNSSTTSSSSHYQREPSPHRPHPPHHKRNGVMRKFIRRFKTRRSHLRGDALELLVLPRRPSSGMLVSTLEEMKLNFPFLKCILLIIPGMAILALIVLASFLTCQQDYRSDERPSLYIALVGTLIAIFLICRMVADWRYQMVRHRKFESAVAMAMSTRHGEAPPSTRSEPLLNADENGVPLSPREGFSKHIRPVLMKNIQLV
jgi:hypothetical protein